VVPVKVQNGCGAVPFFRYLLHTFRRGGVHSSPLHLDVIVVRLEPAGVQLTRLHQWLLIGLRYDAPLSCCRIPSVRAGPQMAFEIRDLLPMVTGAGLKPGQALLHRFLLHAYPPLVSRGAPPRATPGAAGPPA
jgi:hypothetical protein